MTIYLFLFVGVLTIQVNIWVIICARSVSKSI